MAGKAVAWLLAVSWGLAGVRDSWGLAGPGGSSWMLDAPCRLRCERMGEDARQRVKIGDSWQSAVGQEGGVCFIAGRVGGLASEMARDRTSCTRKRIVKGSIHFSSSSMPTRLFLPARQSPRHVAAAQRSYDQGEGVAYEEALRDIFFAIDRDRNGRIDANEIRSTLLDVGLTATDQEVQAVTSDWDKNKDGTIDYDEFKLVVERLASEFDMSREEIILELRKCVKSLARPETNKPPAADPRGTVRGSTRQKESDKTVAIIALAAIAGYSLIIGWEWVRYTFLEY
eukprot:395705-Hanusia_phi.AAC.1